MAVKALHALWVGMSGCGKTRMATKLSEIVSRQNFGVLVCDLKRSRGWHAHLLTTDPYELLAQAQKNTNCYRFIDEVGQMMDPHNHELDALATDSRESCNKTVFMMQDATMVNRVIRGNCTELVMFKCEDANGEHLVRQFGHKQLLDCNALAITDTYSEFLWARGHEPLKLCRLNFATGLPTVVKTYPPPERKFL